MYSYGHLTQHEISEMLQISRPKVSRMLQEAEELGIVQFTVKDPIFDYEEAQQELMNYLKLKLVKIVPSAGNKDQVKQTIGAEASDLLNSQIHDGYKIGISWGTTVNAFVNAYHAAHPCWHSMVVQLVGGMYSRSMHMDGRELARILAENLRCSFSALQATMYVSSTELKALIMDEPGDQKAF